MGTESASGVAQLLAGLAALTAADVAGLPDEQLRAELLALLPAVHQLHAAVLDRVASFDARELAHADGQNVASTWLVNFGRMSKGSALRLVAHGRLMRQLPALADGMRCGTVSDEQLGKVRDLARLIGVAHVRPADRLLADLCAAAGPAEVAKACERIHALVDPDGAEPDPDKDFARREIVFSRCGSMLHIRGRLDAEGGAALQTAVDALLRPPAAFDGRTAPQRRADALVDLARGALAGEHLPQVGGERAHIGLLITPELLFGPAPATAPADSAGSVEGDALSVAGIPPLPDRPWLNWIGEVPPELAQRLACDGAIWRLVVDPRTGMPLDVGNKHRFVPWWMRKALWARDRQCRFPGCDVPCEWTDAHHIVPWWRVKQTDIAGVVSLCRYHHTLVHEGGWELAVDHTSGAVGARRPGGAAYELPPSRPWTSPSRQGARPRTGDPPAPMAA